MALKQKASVGRFTLVAWFVVICLVTVNSVRSSIFNVQVKNSKVYIQADQVPLIDVLSAVSEKTGISLKTGDPLKEVVTLNIEEVSIEDGIRRLLSHRSYVLFYKKLENSRFAPVEIRVFGSNGLMDITSTGAYNKTKMNGPPPEDHTKQYQKRWFEKEFEDTTKLSRQISARPITFMSDMQGPLPGGIQVKMVSKDSIFSKIGIKKGDSIHDVNGLPVNTVEEFIDGIQTFSDNPHMIRIERVNGNREIDPIYIELH